MKFKVTILALFIVISSGLFVSEVLANNCPSSNPSTGVGCTLDNQNYFCNGSCQINSSMPSCSVWAPSPVIAPNYNITTTTGLSGVSTAACASADACGVCASCSGGYPNLCGNYPSKFCKANFTPSSGDTGYVANCSSYASCTEKCSACSGGYSICLAQNKCTVTLPCPGQTFNVCTGLCEGTITSVKLDYDSGGTTAGTTIKQSSFASSVFNIIFGSSSFVGIGTSTPTSLLTLDNGSGIALNMAFGRIAKLSDPVLSTDAATKGYVDILASTTASTAFWQGLSSNIYYNGGNVGIGTTVPLAKLNVVSSGAAMSDIDLMIQRYSNDAQSVYNVYGKARGTSASPSAVLSGDQLGGFYVRGYGASAWSGNTAAMYFSAAENFTNTANGSSIYFATTPIGSNTRADRMIIDNTGNVGIGTTNPAYVLNAYKTTAPQALFNGYSLLAASGNAAAANGSILIGNNSGYQGVLDYDNSGSTNFIIKNSYNNPFSAIGFNIYNTRVMSIVGSNRVGILTASPAEALQVLGNVEIGVDNSNTGATIPKQLVFGEYTTNASALAPSFVFNTATSWVGLGNGATTGAVMRLGSILSGKSTAWPTFGSNPISLVIDGKVGIGTSTPSTYLSFLSYSGSSIGMAGGRITKLSDPVVTDDAATKGYVDLIASTSAASVNSVGKFVSVSTNLYTGNNTGTGGGVSGYTKANQICAATTAGSHVCTSFELLNSISTFTTPVVPAGTTLWIFNGPPGYTWNSNDCNGRNSVGHTDYGTVWVKLATGDGFGSLEFCDTPRQLACCK